MNEPKKYLADLLAAVAQNNASDLHLSPAYYPTLRIDGRLVPLVNQEILSAETLRGLIETLAGERVAKFATEKDMDFSFTAADGNRFRANIYQANGSYAATLRLISK